MLLAGTAQDYREQVVRELSQDAPILQNVQTLRALAELERAALLCI